MASNAFPTTLADLNFRDNSVSNSLYQSIRDIRKSILSIPNRLRSILQDAEYVQDVAHTYDLPLVANERCGSWYIDPASKAGSAYFKSTDGHHGQWSFSLRRLNLQVLSILGQHGGAVIVDSTRRGKNLPDALLKTIPIWGAVMNRALFPERKEFHSLQCPGAPDDLGPSEISQIESRLDGFVAAFKALQLDFETLRTSLGKPIHITWAINGFGFSTLIDNHDIETSARMPEAHRLILCSASRRVVGVEVSEGGYIQGAGDDSEAWSSSLSPLLFWKHKDLLLRKSDDEDLMTVIHTLVADETASAVEQKPRRVKPTASLHIAQQASGTKKNFDIIIDCNNSNPNTSKTSINLACKTGKLGSRDLRDKLEKVKVFVETIVQANLSARILVTCVTGRDLSAGVALMLLCLFYNDNGDIELSSHLQAVDKTFIKQRLAWISSSMPDVNPSRSTLQSVNAFLMSRP